MLIPRRTLLAVPILLSGCIGTASRLPEPQRAYSTVQYPDLYRLLEFIFEMHGYSIDVRDLSRGYMRTAWRELPPEQRALAAWRRQRQYVAWFDLDRLVPSRHMLVLQVMQQERAPLASEWRDRKIEPSGDLEYQQILKRFDQEVKSIGGSPA